MTAAGTFEVFAARYAERETTRSRIYYAWPTYDEPDGAVRMSYYFWLLRPVTGPPIVIDTGFDPELAARKNRTCMVTPAALFGRLGISCAEVEQVIVTHLHYDHIGNLGLFPNAQFTVAERELEFWSSPGAERFQFAEHGDPRGVEFLLRAKAAGRLRLVDHSLEVVPGVSVERVGGHSPGQLIVSIATAGGELLLASDAVHYYEELELDRPFAVIADLAEAYRAFDVINKARSAGAMFVPAHDPLVMDRHPRVDGTLSEMVVRLG